MKPSLRKEKIKSIFEKLYRRTEQLRVPELENNQSRVTYQLNK